MKLIDIEGLDGCGKATQAAMLHSYYDSIGKKSVVLEFPSASPAGLQCVKFQRGKFGDPLTEDPIFSSLLYTVDRAIKLNEPFEYRRVHKSDYVICDRYKMSNLICHLHKLKTDKEKMDYIRFMKTAESDIPQEDITIFLNIPIETSIDFVRQRAKDKSDMNESIEAQKIFRENVQWIFENINFINDLWSDKPTYKFEVISCCNLDGDILTPEAIHKKIVSKIIQI